MNLKDIILILLQRSFGCSGKGLSLVGDQSLQADQEAEGAKRKEEIFVF